MSNFSVGQKVDYMGIYSGKVVTDNGVGDVRIQVGQEVFAVSRHQLKSLETDKFSNHSKELKRGDRVEIFHMADATVVSAPPDADLVQICGTNGDPEWIKREYVTKILGRS